MTRTYARLDRLPTNDLIDHAEVLCMVLGQRVTQTRQEGFRGSPSMALAQDEVNELATAVHILHERLNGMP